MTRTVLNDSLFAHKGEAIHTRVCNAVLATGQPCVVVYDAYPFDADGYPIDNLDLVPFPGPVQIEQDYDEFWDMEGKGRSYVSLVLESPTWLQLAVVANEMILVTGDEHHCFLEGILAVHRLPSGVLLCTFTMGS